jgi:hypothetical protein
MVPMNDNHMRLIFIEPVYQTVQPKSTRKGLTPDVAWGILSMEGL